MQEASFFALCDGKTAVAVAGAQDHKCVGDGDTGPNTGGMGAYSPAPVLTPEIEEQIMKQVSISDASFPPPVARMLGTSRQGPGTLESAQGEAGGEVARSHVLEGTLSGGLPSARTSYISAGISDAFCAPFPMKPNRL